MGPSSAVTVHLNVAMCKMRSKKSYAHIRARLRPSIYFLIDQFLDRLPAVCPSDMTVLPLPSHCPRMKGCPLMVGVKKIKCTILSWVFTISVDPESKWFHVSSSHDLVNIMIIPIISYSKINILVLFTSYTSKIKPFSTPFPELIMNLSTLALTAQWWIVKALRIMPPAVCCFCYLPVSPLQMPLSDATAPGLQWRE